MSIAKTISGDGLPMVSAENFMEVEFEEKFFFYAQQFGLAGAELVRGFALTDKDLIFPMIPLPERWWLVMRSLNQSLPRMGPIRERLKKSRSTERKPFL